MALQEEDNPKLYAMSHATNLLRGASQMMQEVQLQVSFGSHEFKRLNELQDGRCCYTPKQAEKSNTTRAMSRTSSNCTGHSTIVSKYYVT